MPEVWRHAGGLIIGTTAERGAFDTSVLRYGNLWLDTDLNAFLVWEGSAWTHRFADTLETTAGRIVNTTRVVGAHTATVSDEVILCDTDGGAFTVDLPAGVEGTHYRITNCGTSGNDVTVDGDGGETVMGAVTQDLSDGETINIYYNATEGWW